jgi:hypothetical protein
VDGGAEGRVGATAACVFPSASAGEEMLRWLHASMIPSSNETLALDSGELLMWTTDSPLAQANRQCTSVDTTPSKQLNATLWQMPSWAYPKVPPTIPLPTPAMPVVTKKTIRREIHAAFLTYRWCNPPTSGSSITCPRGVAASQLIANPWCSPGWIGSRRRRSSPRATFSLRFRSSRIQGSSSLRPAGVARWREHRLPPWNLPLR